MKNKKRGWIELNQKIRGKEEKGSFFRNLWGWMVLGNGEETEAAFGSQRWKESENEIVMEGSGEEKKTTASTQKNKMKKKKKN